uniref:DUF6589 domain-containing protein n=1 Tax=Knipowitschia caucasica TaxID=637954 RepID=A0AAV2LXL3_KNICA
MTSVKRHTLYNKNRSKRLCKLCITLIGRLERDSSIFRKWQQEEDTLTTEPPPAEGSSSAGQGDKRERCTPSKTPRAVKKIRRSPTTQTAARRSITQVITEYPSKTVLKHAIGKQKELAATCGERLQELKVSTELYLTSKADGHPVDMTSVNDNMEDLTLSDDNTESQLPDSETTEVNSPPPYTTQPELPPTYSVIMDNLDFFMKTHQQSLLTSNTSLHWIHHIAVEDRIQTSHLSDPLHKVVLHHIPHDHSEEMSLHSTDYPLGLIFKNENITGELSDVLLYLQKEYVPKGPSGLEKVFVGGDRLTEGNCRNLQWGFADGATEEERLEGLAFKFEDWHAIRNLFQIHYKIFCNKTSSKDHGTLFSNMNVLSASKTT